MVWARCVLSIESNSIGPLGFSRVVMPLKMTSHGHNTRISVEFIKTQYEGMTKKPEKTPVTAPSSPPKVATCRRSYAVHSPAPKDSPFVFFRAPPLPRGTFGFPKASPRAAPTNAAAGGSELASTPSCWEIAPAIAKAAGMLDHPTTRRADGPAARRPRLKVGDLVLGAPLRQGRDEERRSERIEERDYGLGLVLAASDTAYSTRFMWRYPLGSAGNGAPVGVCDNLCIDRRDLRPASISRVKGTPPPPYLPSDREILEGGRLTAEAAGFRWRRLESDVTDALGLEPPQPGVYS